MHAANFAALGLAASYEAFDVTEAALPARLADLQARGYTGANLTIPLKARGLELVDEAKPRARLLGGVNTILFRPDGRRVGDNTDGFGFLAALREAGCDGPAGVRVLVLGCGGTGRALALTAAQAGAAAVLLANRTAARAADVAAALRAACPGVPAEALPADPAVWELAARACPLVVHTTSQGLQPGDAPLLTRRAFAAGQWVFDAVYTEQRTPILREAAQAGARTLNGLGMLVHQGAESFRLWTGTEPDLAAMHAAVRERFSCRG